MRKAEFERTYGTEVSQDFFNRVLYLYEKSGKRCKEFTLNLLAEQRKILVDHIFPLLCALPVQYLVSFEDEGAKKLHSGELSGELGNLEKFVSSGELTCPSGGVLFEKLRELPIQRELITETVARLYGGVISVVRFYLLPLTPEEMAEQERRAETETPQTA